MKHLNNLVRGLIIGSLLGVLTGRAEDLPEDPPLREISIILTDDGFFPNRLSVFKGERVQLYFTSLRKEGNGEGCFVLKEKGVSLTVARGKIQGTNIYFDLPGRLKFHCPTGGMEGHITVLDRHRGKGRNMASVPSEDGNTLYIKKDQWIPKDF